MYDKMGLSEAQRKAMSDSLKERVPATRFGDTGEVARAIVFLGSDEAPFTVGSDLLMDGGLSLM